MEIRLIKESDTTGITREILPHCDQKFLRVALHKLDKMSSPDSESLFSIILDSEDFEEEKRSFNKDKALKSLKEGIDVSNKRQDLFLKEHTDILKRVHNLLEEGYLLCVP